MKLINFRIRHLLKKNFTKYILVASSSFFLDLVLFEIFNLIFFQIINYEGVIVATILARVLSSLYNYYFSSRLVFKKYTKVIMVKYYMLVIFNMLLSSGLVYVINKYCVNDYVIVIKLAVDGLIFVSNYLIQRRVVFK